MYIAFDETNILDYLQQQGLVTSRNHATAQPLAWGVSNVVLRICCADRPDFVVKQSRPQLRTKADWFSRPERIYREVDVMRGLTPLLWPGVIPRILFEDQSQFLFGMEAVPADHRVWKGELLAEKIDLTLAERLGEILADIHRLTAGNAELHVRWGDRVVFDELRLDPFYRYLQRVYPDLRASLQSLIDDTLAQNLTAVHADFSPKNILLHGDDLTLVDFETGHFGDPTFDLGFFLSHILLKAVARPKSTGQFLLLALRFWDRYTLRMESDETQGTRGLRNHADDLTSRALRHLSACLLARVDGKSPVDYLSEMAHQNFVRRWTTDFLLDRDLPEKTKGSFHHYLDEFAHRLFASVPR
ncbi:MAG: phosphotransferase family protein [Planctomycetaceae bacterium]